MPNMGIKTNPRDVKQTKGVGDQAASYVVPKPSTSLADALFTQTQQRVLGLLFGQPDASFTVSEIIAASGGGSGAVQRELASLAGSGLANVQQVGNQKLYQANPAAPIHAELVSIMQKTTGLAEPLRAALAPLADNITAAFVYGSVAKRSDIASSDIDLMIVSDTLGYADIFGAVEAAVHQLGREVNPTVYTRAELAKRIKSGNAFVTRVLEQPKLWLLGDKDDLGT